MNFKPCPFCDSLDVETHDTGEENQWVKMMNFVECNNCGARGPEEKKLTVAIDRWNKRLEAGS